MAAQTKVTEEISNAEEIRLKKQLTQSGTNYQGFLENERPLQIPKEVLTYWGH